MGNVMEKNKALPKKLVKPLLGLSLLLGINTGASAVGIEDIVDGGNNFAWERIEIPGTKCSDGSQYKFWVYDNPNSNNLVLSYEGGGACWDYASCSGELGKLGAANSNGLPDDYITQMQSTYVSPIMNGNDPGVPLRSKTDLVTKGWDVAYMPYCTGDVHIGNKITTYVDPSGVNPPLNFHHQGYNNSSAALDYLDGRFGSIGKLLITGFSAGGVGSIAQYHNARQRLDINEGYMLNDSGPLFLAPNISDNSKQLHETITVAWDIPSILSNFPASFDINNMGSVNTALSSEYPNDHFAYTGYSTDYNFSRFSYERFFPGIDQAGILAKWQEDQADMVSLMDSLPNYSYTIPWHRQINDSHCSTIITFMGSHSCPSVRQKKWYEVWQWPWSQGWKCPGTSMDMTTFLDRWIDGNQRLRYKEPNNNYNLEDPGMQALALLVDQVL